MIPTATNADASPPAGTPRGVDLGFSPRERGVLRTAAVGSVLITLLALVSALATRAVYDHVLPSHSVASLWAVALALVLVLLLDTTAKMAKHRWVDAASESYDARLSGDLFARLLRTRMGHMARSSVATSLFREFEGVRDLRSGVASGAWVDLFGALLLLAVIAAMAGWLALIPAAGFLSILVAWSAQAKVERLSLVSQPTNIARQSLLAEAVHGAEDVKLARAEGRLTEEMRDLARQASAEGAEIRHVQAVSSLVVGAVAQAVQVGMIVFGTVLAISGSITMGTMIAASVLAGRVTAPCAALASLAMRWGRARVSERTVAMLADAPQERTGGVSPSLRGVTGAISFRGVTYHYPGREDPVLRGVDLDVPPGTVVALVGPRGGGKSTIGRLLTGLAVLDGERDSGEAMIDGVPISQYDPQALRGIVAGCPQDSTLFSRSILENVRMARPGATDDEVLDACRLAGVHEWAARRPGGYGGIVHEGGRTLSGGERQSIGLARTLLADAPVLFLDEPTAHFDPGSTARFVRDMSSWLRGRTAVIATHKAEIAALAGRIAVVAGGRVVRVAEPREIIPSMLPPVVAQAAAAQATPAPARGAGASAAAPAGAGVSIVSGGVSR